MLVVNKEVRNKNITIASFCRPHAKVVFLAITTTEGFFVEKTDFFRKLLVNGHAEPYASRNIDRFGRTVKAKVAVQSAGIQALVQNIIFKGFRKTTNRRRI